MLLRPIVEGFVIGLARQLIKALLLMQGIIFPQVSQSREESGVFLAIPCVKVSVMRTKFRTVQVGLNDYLGNYRY